ncbi:MAG: hypothetical protein WBF58_23390 [Xanthobacteraceae bacterium]
MTAPAHITFRRMVLLLAALLGIECAWLLLPELSRPGIGRLPTSPAAAALAGEHRAAAAWAASLAAVRGDLWAESAYTYAILLWADAGARADNKQALVNARARLNNALQRSPQEAGAWLMLAGIDLRYGGPGQKVTDALKMSYYTGPSAPDLLPLRFALVAQSDFNDDVEMRQFVSRDLRLLLARQQKQVIVQAYKLASPAGQHFIEQAVGDIDPSALQWLRTATQPPPLPN